MSSPRFGISQTTWTGLERMLGSGLHAGSASGTSGKGSASESMILIRNDSESELKPGQIVGIDGLINTPATHGATWDFYRYYKAVKPDPDKFPTAVTLEAIDSGKSGYALVSGVAKVSVEVKNIDHKYARPIRDDLTKVESCAFGSMRLLFRENESGLCQGLVHFPIGESWDWGMVLVKTSDKLSQFSVLGVKDAGIKPSGTGIDGNNANFISRVTITGEKPSKKHNDFVVTLTESSGTPDSLIPALYAGICPCLVNITNKTHTHAYADGFSPLKSANSGFARIVYPTTSLRSTGTQWCYISIPESPPTVFPVTLVKTAGEAGDNKKQCSFRYSVYPFPKTSDSTIITENLNPSNSDSPYRRWDKGRMKPATFGLAVYSTASSGTPKLLLAWCNEIPEIANCEG